MVRSLDHAFPWPEPRRVKVPLPPGMKPPPEEPEPRIQFIAGLSLGRLQQQSALAFVQKTEAEESGAHVRRYHVAQLRRWDLHTAYGDVAAEVQNLFAPPSTEGGTLVIDAAGVGPLVDLFRKGQYKPRAQVRLVHTTGGQDVSSVHDRWKVPESDLAANALGLAECGRLAFDAGAPFAGEMVQELRRFAARVGAGGRPHDKDALVCAVAVALWFGERRQKRLVIG